MTTTMGNAPSAIGYVVTRGLAKSGSYETFTRGRDR